MILDDCHRVGARTYYRAAMKCKAPYRFGLTATPEGRSDNADIRLRAVTGPLFYSLKPKDLIGEWLADAEVIMVKVPVSAKGFTYNEVYTKGIVRNDERNKAIAQIVEHEISKGSKVMIIVNRLAHVSILKKMFMDRYETFVITGRKPPKLRRWIIDKVNTLDSPCVIIASPVGEEGIDIPDLDCIILASGGKAPIQILQRIGRGLRRGTGDRVKRLRIYDFYDLQRSRKSMLRRHSEIRYKLYVETFGFDRVRLI